VEEYTLDMVYENPRDDLDETLEQIVGHLQKLEGDLFDEVVRKSQTEALGAEWFGMKQLPPSVLKVNREMLELALSPYLARLGKQDL